MPFSSLKRKTTVYPYQTWRLTSLNSHFGKMLAIAAVYDSALRCLLDEEDSVCLLFDRTIKFLRVYEGISPTIKNDLRILLHVQAQLFPPQVSHQHWCHLTQTLAANAITPEPCGWRLAIWPDGYVRMIGDRLFLPLDGLQSSQLPPRRQWRVVLATCPPEAAYEAFCVLFYCDFNSSVLQFLGKCYSLSVQDIHICNGCPSVRRMLELARRCKQRARFRARGIRLVRIQQGIILLYTASPRRLSGRFPVLMSCGRTSGWWYEENMYFQIDQWIVSFGFQCNNGRQICPIAWMSVKIEWNRRACGVCWIITDDATRLIDT